MRGISLHTLRFHFPLLLLVTWEWLAQFFFDDDKDKNE
jgi:hypothetical protein